MGDSAHVRGHAPTVGHVQAEAVIRALVVDDHALHREGTRRILEQHPDIEVVADADCGEAAVQLVEDLRPSVVLLDMRLPGINGIETTRRIHSLDPGVRILVVTAYDDDEYVRGAVQAGAAGYLSKAASGRELVEAVRTVAAGGSVLEPSMLARLVTGTPELRVTAALSDRERDVLQLLAAGLQNKQVALQLGISPRTVERHCDGIYAKLGVRTRTEAVVRALTAGLVSDPHVDA